MEAAEAKSRSDRGVPPSPADVGGGGGRPSGAAKAAGPRGSRNLAAGQGGFPRPPGKPGPGPSAALPMTVHDDNAGSTRVPSSAVREQTLDLGPRTPFAWDA